nr:hypothetical protein [Tanacetum cinerariifolium]
MDYLVWVRVRGLDREQKYDNGATISSDTKAIMTFNDNLLRLNHLDENIGESSKSDSEREGLEDEGPDFKEDEEVAPEGQQQQEVQVMDTTMNKPIGLGCKAARRRALELTEVMINILESYTLGRGKLDMRFLQSFKAWAGQTDAQRMAMWHDIQWENYDLRRQIAKERRERLELTNRVARMERRQESEGE